MPDICSRQIVAGRQPARRLRPRQSSSNRLCIEAAYPPPMLRRSRRNVLFKRPPAIRAAVKILTEQAAIDVPRPGYSKQLVAENRNRPLGAYAAALSCP